VAPTTSDIVDDIRSTPANIGAEYQLEPSQLQDFVPMEHHGDLASEVLPAADMDTLSEALEKERSVTARGVNHSFIYSFIYSFLTCTTRECVASNVEITLQSGRF